MRIVDHPQALQCGTAGASVAIGVFDGVHVGHQQILTRMLDHARGCDAISVVATFDRHPNAIVAPDRVPPMIYGSAQKMRALESLGVEATLVLRFDEALSRKTGETFLRELAGGLGRLRGVAVGAGFTFGHRRSGNLDLLRRLGVELGFDVQGIPEIDLEGQAVSSTRIRQTIREGQLESASRMLGRPYRLGGAVVRGGQLGAKLGFPTANLDTTGLVLPPNGVYAVRVSVGNDRHRGVLNIGCRPTVNSDQASPRAEVHLLDFSGDLYGHELEVEFVRRLRAERRFDSVEALREQISRDIAEASVGL